MDNPPVIPPFGNAAPARSISLIVGSGAVGGMVYWILQVAAGISPFGFRWYGSIPAALLVGGVAALSAI